MIVVFPFSLKDQEQAVRCANWILELQGGSGFGHHKCLIVRDARAQNPDIAKTLEKCCWSSIETLVVHSDAWDHWPESCNHMFSLAARHIEAMSDAQPWLWLEADAIPLRRGWADALETEYKAAEAAGKVFLGDRVDVPGVPLHLSGVAVYPARVIDYAGLALIALEVAWDCAARDQILPRCQETKLIEHSWKHPTFENWEQVTREVDLENAVVYHASKDGSLILRLQEQRAREAGIRGLSGEDMPNYITADVSHAPPSQPVTDILIKTYPKDYEWLSYCLRGLQKFATGFRHIIVIFPINEAGPVIPTDQRIPVSALPMQERGEPYLWQQVVKFNAHEYTNATYVLHIDSDTVATAPFTPETFIRDGKPLWLMTPYSSIKAPWQPITEKFLGERVDFEFMRRFPMLIPRALHVAASKFVEIRHNRSAADYIISQPAHDFSEFNALGALAYSRARDDFSWLDTTKEELPELVAIQSWSHGGLSDQLREKFENILSGGVESRHAALPCKHGDVAKDGLMPSAHKLVQPNNASGSSAPPAQSLLVGGGLAHAAAGQILYEKEETKKDNIGDGLVGGELVRGSVSSFGADGGRTGIGDAPEGLLPRLGAQETKQEGTHQTKEGWWVIDGDTHISKWVEDEGRLDHDQYLLPKILPEINEGDVVVDAGAFIGDHAIAYVKAVGDKGHVVCFEPNPLACQCLRLNLGAIGLNTTGQPADAEIYQVALSSENVAYPFEILPNAGASAIVPRSETNVQAITLDSLKLQRLNFFKIDVEGHELSVLKGAEETIMRCHPKLLIEIHKWPLLRQKVEARAIFDWLKSHGYRWSSVQPMHVADPPQYDILCRPITQGANVKKVVPWESPLETKEEISRLILRLKDFVTGATPSQIRFVRQELIVHDVTRRPRDYNWVVIRKRRNAMKRRLAKGIKDEG